jgi:hypothetical protein
MTSELQCRHRPPKTSLPRLSVSIKRRFVKKRSKQRKSSRERAFRSFRGGPKRLGSLSGSQAFDLARHFWQIGWDVTRSSWGCDTRESSSGVRPGTYHAGGATAKLRRSLYGWGKEKRGAALPWHFAGRWHGGDRPPGSPRQYMTKNSEDEISE